MRVAPAAIAILLTIAARPVDALAVFSLTVDSLADTSDANPGDCLCADADGGCTLRAASEELSAIAFAPDVCALGDEDAAIYLNVAGTIAAAGEIGIARGPSAFLTTSIIGPGSDQLTISGATLVVGGNANGFTLGYISGVAITDAPIGVAVDGTWLDGGGAYLTDVVLTGNAVGVRIGPWGSVEAHQSKIIGNTGDGIDSYADALSDFISLVDTEVTGNGGSGVICMALGCWVTDSVLSGNNGCGLWGGSMFEPIVRVATSRISENTACGLQNNGQATYVYNTTINSNGGGGLFAFRYYTTFDGTLSVFGSTISNNQGPGLAFGVNTLPSSVVNSTISGNQTIGSGAGIQILGPGSALVASSTITDNVADSDSDGDGDGGGVLISTEYGFSPTVELRNTVVAQNTDLGGEAPDCAGAVVSGGHNLLGDTAGCTVTGDVTGNVVGVNARLSPLQDNGGPTATHALLVGSPALDAGNPAGCADADGSPLTDDQRGAPRTKGAACDIGAYESACGDGAVDLGENCDDGNRLDGDCCSSLCTLDASGTPCDDGNACTAADTCAAGLCVSGLPPTCDPCEVCDPSVGCGLPTAPGCSTPSPGGSIVVVRNSDNDPRDVLTWKWKAPGPLPLSDVGSPGTGTAYTLCLIDSRNGGPTLLTSASTPSDGLCDGAPCWSFQPRGYRYLDATLSAGGLFKMLLRPSLTARGRITVKGKGDGLGLPTFPLVAPVTVRLLRSDGRQCWEANFSAPPLSNEGLFRARAD